MLFETFRRKIHYKNCWKEYKKNKIKEYGIRIYPKGPKVTKAVIDEEIPKKRKRKLSTSSESVDENFFRDVAVSGYDIIKKSGVC